MVTAEQFPTLTTRTTSFGGFDTFDCPKGIGQVTYTGDEITAICPVTGQPDYYSLELHYRPRLACVESKSLKLYLQQFRETGMFCEEFASLIAHDLYAALRPIEVTVRLIQKSRGGLTLDALVIVPSEDER
jgi:7-cyano-7-deazaguanine reductase